MSRKIFIAGHRGLVGSALHRLFAADSDWQVVTRARAELDLADRDAVQNFFRQERPQVIIDAAAKVGGIKANNDYPVEFLLENLRIQNNLIEAAHDGGVEKFLFLGSSCIYPKLAPQPMPEECLLTGPLEPTNDAYAIAKIAGIKLCQSYWREYGDKFISAMPTNIYGPNDYYDPERSHVLPGMIGKFHRAKVSGALTVTLWGTGSPYREFLHSDDLASACRFLIEHYDSPEIINIGTGQEVTIKELALMVRDAVGFQGEIVWDTTKPDGTPRKLLDCRRLSALGWRPSIPLREGIAGAYHWFLEHYADARGAR